MAYIAGCVSVFVQFARTFNGRKGEICTVSSRLTPVEQSHRQWIAENLAVHGASSHPHLNQIWGVVVHKPPQLVYNGAELERPWGEMDPKMGGRIEREVRFSQVGFSPWSGTLGWDRARGDR